MLKRVLMCKPTHFQIEYSINPWMEIGAVDPDKALQQWESLVKIYQKHGIEVEIIEQSEYQPDMVFAADQGLVVNKSSNQNDSTVILSNFKHQERRGETKYYMKWFLQNGYKVEFLPGDVQFEGGGEILHWKDKYLIGRGFRNSTQAYQVLQEEYNLNFISFELINPRFYHLDTCMFVLNSDTIFYYPPAFSSKSIELIKKTFANPIEFSDEEVNGFAANSVVTDNLVFVQTGNPSFNQKLIDLGYTVEIVNINEFIKAGGGIHCLTFELDRLKLS